MVRRAGVMAPCVAGRDDRIVDDRIVHETNASRDSATQAVTVVRSAG